MRWTWGGTFTDICVFDDESGSTRVGKVSSTRDPIDAVFEGVEEVSVALDEIGLFSHGTTVATNALITRSFPRAAMITTKGFKDVIEIRRGTKQDLWDAYKDAAPPYIRRRDRFEVTERVDYAGKELEPVDEDEVRHLAHLIRRRGIETVAVCLMNAHVNPEHETRVKEILEEELPDVAVSTSSEVLPEIFEHERFSTTVANAVLAPLVGNYAKRLAERLKEGGYKVDVLLLHSGGGVITADVAEGFGARLASSGLAAGAIAGGHIAKLAGYENAVSLDMGGTSADISLMVDGATRVTTDWYVEYGYPIKFPSVEVFTIGAGGGSIAWIDPAGSLRNGPQSAGSDPGPACYGRGGDEPTNTDCELAARPARREADRRRDDARPRRPPSRPSRAWPSRSGSGYDRGRTAPSSKWPTPTWLTLSDSPSIRRGHDPATSCSSRSAARGRCTVRSWRASFDPDGARAAEPGHHLGPGLSARGHPPRPLGDVPGPCGGDGPGRNRGAVPALEDEARERLAARASSKRTCSCCAPSTCATSGSGVRSRSRSMAGGVSRGPDHLVPRRARPGARLQAR